MKGGCDVNTTITCLILVLVVIYYITTFIIRLGAREYAAVEQLSLLASEVVGKLVSNMLTAVSIRLCEQDPSCSSGSMLFDCCCSEMELFACYRLGNGTARVVLYCSLFLFFFITILSNSIQAFDFFI